MILSDFMSGRGYGCDSGKTAVQKSENMRIIALKTAEQTGSTWDLQLKNP